MHKLFQTALLLFPFFAFSQKTINVVGTSEILLEPTRFEFSIALMEFMDGKESKSIQDLEENLIKAMEKAGVEKESLRISSFYGNTYQIKRKKGGEYKSTKNYQLTLKDVGKLEKVLDNMDQRGVSNVHLIEATRDDLQEVRKKNRIAALKASKEKAEYLLAEIGKTAGEALKISEMPIQDGFNPAANTMRVYSSGLMDPDEVSVQRNYSIEFRKIKIISRIYAVYEIKD